ncbi:HET-domain-containing protein [Xylaria sp. FL1042]|nr:HET-domain-containing protein [Xylaria sp. FL1042]
MSIQYRALSRDRSEIRLLRLLPSSGTQYARIPCCRLLQTSLRNAPRYKALSYAWGSATTNRVIMVDGIGIRIPENLFNALITLRPPKFEILIWVDYLCINQRDDMEKSWQVALMGDIYKRAHEVLAWLGLGDDESQRAIEYLNEIGEVAYACGLYDDLHIGDAVWVRLARLYSRRPASFPFELIHLRRQLEQEFDIDGPILQRLVVLFDMINGWNGEGKIFPIPEMKKLLERPWFGRIWVLQEIALSQEAIFICGNMKINRTRLAAAMSAYQCFSRALWGMFDDLRALKLYHLKIVPEMFFRAAMMANAHRVKRSYFPLIALLRLTCVGSHNLQKHGPHHLDSSDPRDKIFALLSLASDREDLSEKGVSPDYMKTCREVYTLTTAAMLRQGHISLLSLVQPHRTSTHGNLPSWVPDWYQPLTTPLQIVRDDHMILEPKFNASGTMNPRPIVKIDKDATGIHGISLQGYICDEVHSVGSFPSRRSSWDVPLEETSSWSEEWLVEVLRLTYQTKRKFPSFRERLHAVARASVGGMIRDRDTRGNLIRTNESILWEARCLLQKSRCRIKDRHMKIEVCKFLERAVFQDKPCDTLTHISSDINGRSLKRLPFITRAGRLGLGYDNIKPGDVVAILGGAQVPYILRLQQNGKYNIISEAYVDEIMDGETLEGAIFKWLDIV